MRNLIKGDLIRTLRKVSFWILFLIMSGVDGLLLMTTLNKGLHDDFSFFAAATTYITTGSFVFCLNTLISVYADEFKSSAYITVIGKGLSRTKLVIAKFIDCHILLIIQYVLSSVVILAMGAIMGHTLRGHFLGIYVFTMLSSGSTALISVAFATIFAFLTERIPTTLAAYFVSIFIGGVIPAVLNFMPVRIFFSRYYFDSLNSSALTDFIFGNYAKSICVTIVTFCIYVGIPLFLSTLVFRKKELEL